MNDLSAHRRFFAEEIQVVSNLKSTAVISALSTVARERFLPPGPWTIRGEADFQSAPRQTPDADPRHVYHNVAVAIDPARMLFNGAPGLLAMVIDALAPRAGDRVLHIGTGLGYYTALIAECVGESGHVVGFEVDPALAAAARANLGDYPWVEVRDGDGAAPLADRFDAILVNAGVTHPLPTWLAALTPGGRLMMPLTATMPAMTNIGKGPLVLITNDGSLTWPARVAGFVAIYTALGIRDDYLNTLLGQALGSAPFAPLKSFRRDAHDRQPTCWLHTADFCLSLTAPQGAPSAYSGTQ